MIPKNTENNQSQDQQGKEKKKPSPKGPKFNLYWVYGLIALALIAIQFFSWNPGIEEIDWQQFKQEMLKSHDVEKLIVVNKERVEVYLKEEALQSEKYKDVSKSPLGGVNKGPHFFFTIGSVEFFQQKLEEAQANFEPEEKVSVKYVTQKNWATDLLAWLIPIAILVIIWIFIMRRMSGGMGGTGSQIFNIGKSKATLFDKDLQVNVTFDDVAGLDEAKEEVKEIVSFLKEPQKYTTLGGKIPKGALLVGPPGTGKTLLAKAVAGEAKVPFFSISGSDFVEMFVGVGASRVRDLFRQAREKAPCIIFMDEIDAIGRTRGRNMIQSNDERENTLNQLLVEMDGFGSETGVIMLAATNRPDVLDPALLRPGRFDRQISIDNPDLNGREQIFNVHMKPLKVDKNVDAKKLAAQTPGFAGAEIANVCNEAALIAARKNKKQIEMDDFQDAIDRVIGGLEKKNKLISPEEKKIIAYHEAGHAICGWFFKHAHPLVKVSIIPRGIAALGYAQYMPKEQYLLTKEQLIDIICMALGGRVAEEVIFGEISTGAQNDLERVTQMAYAMVTRYGMSEKVGKISFSDNDSNGYSFSKPYSDETAHLIDKEVRDLLNEAYQRTKTMMIDKKDELEKLAKELLEKEILYKDDLERLIGRRPFDNIEIPSSESKAEEKEKEKAISEDIGEKIKKDPGSEAIEDNIEREHGEERKEGTSEDQESDKGKESGESDKTES